MNKQEATTFLKEYVKKQTNDMHANCYSKATTADILLVQAIKTLLEDTEG